MLAGRIGKALTGSNIDGLRISWKESWVMIIRGPSPKVEAVQLKRILLT